MESLKDATVLVVDDEPDLCDMLGFEFRMRGSQVYYAYSGEKAIGIVESTKIDAVITDIRMSNGNGIQLLERIRLRDDRMPAVVFITAYDTAVSPQEAYNRGAEGIFPKPFRLRDLVERVESVLTNPEQKWAAPPAKPVLRTIESRLPELETARQRRLFDLGRGGFALSGVESDPGVGDEIWFNIQFLAGAIPMLTGQGLVRWADSDADDNTAICGIEFLYLAENSRRSVLAWLAANTCRPYIPLL
jgi:CheY-like chemotaxis protein